MNSKLKIKNNLIKIPHKPGVYIFKNKRGVILYVGKAKDIKKRVSSYFNNSNLSTDKRLMLPKINTIDYIVADSELEALLLESNLIKKHQPKYNIILKDDKQYQYIKIDYIDDFPKIYSVRQIKNDKSSYYGPFTDSYAVKNTLNLLNKLFPYRECNLEIFQDSGEELKRKVCLRYHIKRCLGPCVGKISKDEYNTIIRQCELFLQGKQEKILSEIKKEMKDVAQKKNFEKAALLRDQIEDFKKVIEKQKIISSQKINQDIVSLYKKNNIAIINLFIVREGKLIGKENFKLLSKNKSKEEVFSSFIKQYYLNQNSIPKKILIPLRITDQYLISALLSKNKNKKTTIINPQRGKNIKLIKLGEKNAKLYYANLFSQQKPKIKLQEQQEALKELVGLFKLKTIPKRIECYDISNIQGTAATGSMVVFQNGLPKKSFYRRFKIKFKSISDTDMMKEMLFRRFAKYLEYQNISQKKWPLPNLIIIDGGQGQLNAAIEVLKKQKLNIPLISIAKKMEELYSPNLSQPIKLSRNSKALQLIQRIRDEAHRFAVSYHRKLKEKEIPASTLDNIPGVGPKRKKKLLKKFKSIENIKNAKFEELKNILGEKLARKIINNLG